MVICSATMVLGQEDDDDDDNNQISTNISITIVCILHNLLIEGHSKMNDNGLVLAAVVLNDCVVDKQFISFCGHCSV